MTLAEEEKPKKRGGCLRRFGRLALGGLVFLAIFLVWLNGFGFRWLGPKVAAHYLAKAGLEGSVTFGGTLLGGVEVHDLELKGAKGSLERLVVKRLVTDYRFSEVIRGKLRGISGEGIHAEIRLVETKEEKEPLDLAALVKTIRGLRGNILPLEVKLADVSFSVKKDGARVVELEASDFTHKGGDESIELSLGRIIDAGGRFTQKQKAAIKWKPDRLTLNKIDLLPFAGLRDLAVVLPEGGEISAEGMLRLGGAVLRLDVSEGIRSVRVDLIEGELDFGKLIPGFGLGSPLKGRLTSLALEVRDVYPEWQSAVGTVEVFLEGFSYDGWEVPELSAGVSLEERKISAKLAGKSLGSGFMLEGGGKFERVAIGENGFLVDGIAGDFRVEKLAEVLRTLDRKLGMGGRFKAFPESAVSGKWTFGMDGGLPAEVGVDLVVKAADATVSPIRLDAKYMGKVVTVRALETEGRKISGTFDTETRGYVMHETMQDFRTDGVAPWLRGAGLQIPGSGTLTLDWESSGNLLTNSHKGELRGLSGNWKWNGNAENPVGKSITASARKISYDWPGNVKAEGLVLQTDGQTVKLEGALAGGELNLESFTWLDGEAVLANGQGKLPVPENFSKWREFLENDPRPLDLTIRSETIPLAKLRPWVKGLEQIGDKATGKLDVIIAGSLAAPEVDAVAEIRNVSVPGRKEVPTTDVTLNLKARDGRAEISALAVAPDYAPATLKAEMPFLPKKWAQAPDSLMTEKIAGTLDLPRLDLSRFQSLIPGAVEFGGVTEGKVTIAGTLGEPKVDGNLKLSGGKLRMKGNTIPALEGIGFEVDADLKSLKIKGGVANLAGGDLKIDGSLQLKNEAGDGLGVLDVSVKGTALPVVRNEYLILRANADLRIKGTMANAQVTGEVGIIDSVFFKDMELIPIGKPFLAPSAASLPHVDAPDNPGGMVPAPFSAWTADVVVKTIDPILIRGNLGSGKADVAIRIGGKLGDPKPDGKVRVTDLVARLPFSTLQVREGYLNFTPQTGFDPALEIRGSSEPRPYRVQVYVYGKASDPQLVLTSQPPLPEDEIMTLLATGTTAAGLEDSQAASSRAMQLLVEEMRRGRFLFGKQLRPVLGLFDNVDFSLSESDPYDTSTFNSARLKLSEKWYISAGLSVQGEQRVMALWRLRFR